MEKENLQIVFQLKQKFDKYFGIDKVDVNIKTSDGSLVINNTI
jgi:hypothetical protein